jgi:hypothetical protein
MKKEKALFGSLIASIALSAAMTTAAFAETAVPALPPTAAATQGIRNVTQSLLDIAVISHNAFLPSGSVKLTANLIAEDLSISSILVQGMGENRKIESKDLLQKRVVLAQYSGFEAATLKVDPSFNAQSGGPATLTYTYGVDMETSKTITKDLTLELTKTGNSWSVQVNDSAGRHTITQLKMQLNMDETGPGIKSVDFGN